jgi:ABC-type polysaccharide/polyol phosphate export permease
MSGPADGLPLRGRGRAEAGLVAGVAPRRGTSADDADWTVNSASGSWRLPWGELWRGREIVGFFALRDLRVRYKQAVLGIAWVVLQPLVTVVAFTLVFDRLADVDSQGIPYPAFALAGLVGWTYLSQCIGRGSDVLVSNSSLITKVYIPRLTAPLASLLPPLADALVGLVLLGVVCFLYGVSPGPQLLLLPLWVALLALTALGPTCFLAALNVRFRDVRQIVPTALQALLFLSPVGYSSASLDGAAQHLYALNPVVGALEFGRFVLIGGSFPGTVLAISATVSVLLAAAGVLFFHRASRAFADVI